MTPGAWYNSFTESVPEMQDVIMALEVERHKGPRRHGSRAGSQAAISEPWLPKLVARSRGRWVNTRARTLLQEWIAEDTAASASERDEEEAAWNEIESRMNESRRLSGEEPLFP